MPSAVHNSFYFAFCCEPFVGPVIITYSNLNICLPEFLRISCLGKLKVCLSVINVGPFYFTCMSVKVILFLFEVLP